LSAKNQSIDDSDAPLARDIRVLIRERIGQGESSDAARAYLVSRYGDFTLLNPVQAGAEPRSHSRPWPRRRAFARRRAPRSTPALTADEEARLAALTNGDASSG
jgi:cytochrome c-type biogenesis protein CcmH